MNNTTRHYSLINPIHPSLKKQKSMYMYKVLSPTIDHIRIRIFSKIGG